jgi:ribosomal protein S17E
MESNREVFKNVRGILYDNSRRSKRGLFKRWVDKESNDWKENMEDSVLNIITIISKRIKNS